MITFTINVCYINATVHSNVEIPFMLKALYPFCSLKSIHVISTWKLSLISKIYFAWNHFKNITSRCSAMYFTIRPAALHEIRKKMRTHKTDENKLDLRIRIRKIGSKSHFPECSWCALKVMLMQTHVKLYSLSWLWIHHSKKRRKFHIVDIKYSGSIRNEQQNKTLVDVLLFSSYKTSKCGK